MHGRKPINSLDTFSYNSSAFALVGDSRNEMFPLEDRV